MPRNRNIVRQKLRAAALELYLDQGFERTTTAAIAERAGVTERTFFRHFPDKREVLFDGEDELNKILTREVRAAAEDRSPWETLFNACLATEVLLLQNRSSSGSRRQVIANSPALQERELAKINSLVTSLTAILSERGVSSRKAKLAAQIGIAAFGIAYESWIDEGMEDFSVHLAQAFADTREIVAPKA